MLELKGIQKAYSNKRFTQQVLKNINLSFRDSEFVVLLGPSGSGKTTFLNIVSGLDSHDEGDILINKVSTKKYRQKDWDKYRNHTIGFIFQNYNLISHQSVQANVELALALSGKNTIQRQRAAKRALKQVGLEKEAHKLPNQLSGGQMQRVAIARAIVGNPDIIFADEPTGALDTKSGKEIMNLLKELGKNKLVIVATHNSALARRYATRTVHIEDGKITKDTNPFDATNARPSKHYRKKRTSLSFIAAYRLSLSNLWHKKGRAFITIAAGAVGIIGIAFIIALANGMRTYVGNMEANTLSQYPLQITQSKSKLSTANSIASTNKLETPLETTEKAAEINKNTPEGRVALKGIIGPLLSSNGVTKDGDLKARNNDIASLKSYLDTNPDNFNNYVTSVEYNYNTAPVIYANNSNGVYEVYPNPLLGSIGSNSGSMSASSKASATSASSFQSVFQSFSPLPKDKSIYEDSYKVLAGHWPENSHEAVLVLHQDGTINDSTLYTLGLRNFQKDVEPLIEKAANGEAFKFPGQDETFAYEDFLNVRFKVISPAEAYAYNSRHGVWEDMSWDFSYMDKIIKNAEDLNIVGVVLPPQDSKNAMTLTYGINYAYDLNTYNLDKVKNSGVVQAQLASPDVDVLSGQSFAALNDSEHVFDNFDFSNVVSINLSKLGEAIRINQAALDAMDPTGKIREFKLSEEEMLKLVIDAIDDEEIEKIIEQFGKVEDFSEGMIQVTQALTKKYLEEAEKHPGLLPEDFFKQEWIHDYVYALCLKYSVDITETTIDNIISLSTKIENALINYIYNEVKAVLVSVVDWLFDDSAGHVVEFYPEKLSEVVRVNVTTTQITQMYNAITGMSSRTYKKNLADFGYVDLNDPIALTIYPKDFDGKEKINEIISKYNAEQQDKGATEKVIDYTDYSKIFVNVMAGAITAISVILIAFISGSLIVSSLLIGVIAFISVLQRKREIGILRAIGARKRDVARVFNAETILVGFFAGVFGVGLVALLCIPINMAAKNNAHFDYDIAILPWWAVFALIGLSILLTFIAGFIPAKIASRKNPVDAIKDE